MSFHFSSFRREESRVFSTNTYDEDKLLAHWLAEKFTSVNLSKGYPCKRSFVKYPQYFVTNSKCGRGQVKNEHREQAAMQYR